MEVSKNGKKVHIHKTTVVWLLQEGEHVSADRLFRIRHDQPFANHREVQVELSISPLPVVKEKVQIGDVCI